MRLLSSAVALLSMSCVLASCWTMPVIVSEADPEPFQAADLGFLKPGETSLDQTLEPLGEPTLARKGGQMLIYAAAAMTERVVMAGQGSMYTHYYLFVDLAGDETVAGFEVVNSRDHFLDGVQGKTACRASGVCILQSPWVWKPPPPWDPLGEEVLPRGWDIAVVTDTTDADTHAKAHMPGPAECSLYLWGLPGGYSDSAAVSVDGGEWRSLLYETVLPQSSSRRTFIWKELTPGRHVLQAAFLTYDRQSATGEYPFECRPAERLFLEVSRGGVWRAEAKFENLPAQEGRERLRTSHVILE